jgi:hypothetical protein
MWGKAKVGQHSAVAHLITSELLKAPEHAIRSIPTGSACSPCTRKALLIMLQGPADSCPPCANQAKQRHHDTAIRRHSDTAARLTQRFCIARVPCRRACLACRQFGRRVPGRGRRLPNRGPDWWISQRGAARPCIRLLRDGSRAAARSATVVKPETQQLYL